MPKSHFPESFSCENSEQMNNILKSKVAQLIPFCGPFLPSLFDFRSFEAFLYPIKVLNFSRIRTRIIKLEGSHADH